MKITTSLRRTYELKGKGDQDAKIHFLNGKFEECMYRVNNIQYTTKDWAFLKQIAIEIEKCIAIEYILWKRVCKALGKQDDGTI